MQLETYERRAKHNVSESTVNSRMSALRKFRDYISEDREPTVEDLENWIDHLIVEYEEGKIKAGTIRQYYKAVKYYMDTIHGMGESVEHIYDWIPSGDTNHGDYLTKEEWELLLANTYEARMEAIIELMYRYGRRPGEVILLNMDDIVFPEDISEEELAPGEEPVGNITFPILKKREVLRATFELRPEAEAALRDYLRYRTPQTVDAEYEWEEREVEPVFTTSNGRISYSTVWRNVKKIGKRTRLEKNITPKSMRHTRATHLDWEGHSPGEIARHQLVHEPDTDVISAYIHDRSEEQVREVMTTEEEV